MFGSFEDWAKIVVPIKCISCGEMPQQFETFHFQRCERCNRIINSIAKRNIEEIKPMKKYRCKIDSPFGKKGDIQNEFKGLDWSYSDYPDLFEEIPDRWVPEIGEVYWTIAISNGDFVVSTGEWYGPYDTVSNARLNSNRVFRTKEKAEEVLNKMLQILEENKEV